MNKHMLALALRHVVTSERANLSTADLGDESKVVIHCLTKEKTAGF